jgi:HD-GYP domain-containing protein (c-di-GMP phosphodiesterase class II)
MAKPDMKQSENLLEALVETGILLSAEHSLDNLLEATVETARALFNAEGASLYLVEGDKLRFRIFRNPGLEEKIGPQGIENSYKIKPIPIGPGSISGYSAWAEQSVIIPDAYSIPQGAPYTFNPSFDKESGYRTKNLVAQPLRTRSGEKVGVLQLVNVKAIDTIAGSVLRALEAFGAQVAVAVENTMLTERLKRSQYETITRLAAAAELKDPDTGEHLKRMSDYSKRIAKAAELSQEEVDIIYYASPLHDVGKIAIPDGILLKPGPLNDEEWKVMRSHTTVGADILKDPESRLVAVAHDIALSHHERFDGKGYPNKIASGDIPIHARVVSIADVFDALTSRRPYKEPFPTETAIEMIVSGAEKGQFDPVLVKAFTKEFEPH